MSLVIHNTKYTIHKILFYILLMLLPTQLGYHFWPTWSLVLGRRIDYLSPTLYLTDIIIIFLLGTWLLSRPKIVHPPIFKIVLFIGFIVANIFFAANKMVAAFAWLKIVEMIALGLYIVQTKPKFSQIIFPLSISVLYSSVIAIAQFFLQHSIGGQLWFLGERTFSFSAPGIARVDFGSLFKLRPYATFSHPNVLGGFLAITLPLIVTKRHDTKKIFLLPAFIFGIVALVLTFSRSAWVIFVLGISYIVYRKNKKLFIPVVLLIIVLLFIIGRTFGFQDESVVVRQQLNAAAVSMFTSAPIIGNGLGNFLVRLPGHLVSRTIYFLQPVHNIYLLILSETGMVGLAIFLWLIGKALKKENPFIFLLLLGLVDHYFLTLQQGQLLFTVFLSLSLIQ